MTRYAALLRGVNVGGRAKIAMADFRAVLEELGFTDVKTLLQSGNAVFGASGSAARLPSKIEKALTPLGLTTRCVVRSADEIAAVVAGHPLESVADNGSKMVAVFLSADLDSDLAAEVEALDPDTIRVGDRVVYQWCPDGILQAAQIVPMVTKRTDIVATARNWNTVIKINNALHPA